MRKNPLSAAIIIFCVCLATVSCGGGQQTDPGGTGSNLLETYDDPTETPQVDLPEFLCEEGWEIFDRAESDFGDQAYRYIFVVYRESETAERMLKVIKEYKDGDYEVIAENKNAILNEDEGGIYGDPYAGMKLDHHNFVLEFYGGSNWRWRQVYTFDCSDESIKLVSGTKIFFKIGETDEESDEETEENILKNEGGYIAEYDYEMGVARIREKKAEKVITKEEELEKGSVDIGNFEVGDV